MKGSVVDYVVLLHANWCGWCKRLMPEWRKVKKQYATIDLEVTKYPEIRALFQVQSFPTIAIVRIHRSEQGHYRLLMKTFKTNGGERNARTISAWLEKSRLVSPKKAPRAPRFLGAIQKIHTLQRKRNSHAKLA